MKHSSFLSQSHPVVVEALVKMVMKMAMLEQNHPFSLVFFEKERTMSMVEGQPKISRLKVLVKWIAIYKSKQTFFSGLRFG